MQPRFALSGQAVFVYSEFYFKRVRPKRVRPKKKGWPSFKPRKSAASRASRGERVPLHLGGAPFFHRRFFFFSRQNDYNVRKTGKKARRSQRRPAGPQQPARSRAARGAPAARRAGCRRGRRGTRRGSPRRCEGSENSRKSSGQNVGKMM